MHLTAIVLLGLAIFSAQVAAQTVKPAPKPTPEVQRLLDEGAAGDKTWAQRLPVFEQALKVAQERGDRVGEGLALNWIGRCNFDLGQPAKALEYYERALPIRKYAGDRGGEAVTLNNIGLVYDRIGQPAKARYYYELALPILREVGDQVTEATTLSNIGNVCSSIGQPANAREYYEQALHIQETLKNERGQAVTLANLGVLARNLGQPDKAISYYNRALPLQRAVGDRFGEAIVLTSIGVVYSDRGDSATAIGYLVKSLNLRREVGDLAGEGATLHNLGAVYQSIGQPAKALEFYENALAISRRVKDRRQEAATLNNTGFVFTDLGRSAKALEFYELALPILKEIGDLRGAASTLNNIAAVNNSIGQTGRALDSLERLLTVLDEIGDKRTYAVTLSNIAIVYSGFGEPSKALKYFDRALKIRKEVQDLGGEAQTLAGIGSTYDSLGQSIRALQYFEQALRIFREIKDRVREATTLNNIGLLYGRSGESAKALEHHNLALSISLEIRNRSIEATSLSQIGSVYQSLGDYAKALNCFEKSVALAETLEIQGEVATGHVKIGTLFRETGQPAKALERYEHALPILVAAKSRSGVAQVLGGIASLMVAKHPLVATYFAKQSANASQSVRLGARGLDGELRGRLSRKNEAVFRFLAPLLLDQSREAEALHAMDLLKAQERTEADRAAWSGAMPLTPVEAKWDAQIEAAGRTLSEVGAREQALRLRKDTAGAKALEPELEKLRTAYSATIRRVMEDSKKGGGKLESTPAFERIKRATPKGTAAVYALYRENDLHLLVATNGSLRSFKTSVKDLGKRVTTFRQVLEDPTRDPRPSGLAIYKVLAAPIEAHLKAEGVKTVLWSLDGALRLIPVGALWDGEKFLVARRVHAYFPGSDALRPDDKRTGYRVLACGASKAAPGYTALPGVDAELSAIAAAFPGKPLRNGEFTRKALEAGLRAKPTVLHLASHFSLRPGPPENSQLLLGDGTKMSLQELESLPNSLFASLRLVVLSACETAPGAEDSDGYAAEGMAERLLRKGVGAVAASLWPVADQPTAELMRRMYAKLAANPKTSPLAALRSVQLEFLSGRQIVSVPAGVRRSDTKAKRAASAAPKWPTGLPRYAHPYYWAPFVLTGNSR